MKRKLAAQSKEDRERKSLRIAGKFFSLKAFKKAKIVMFYLAKDGEVETRQMIAKAQALGKRIVVPHINRKTRKMLACQLKDMHEELCEGPYGIHQPKEDGKRTVGLDSINLVVVPGIAFSLDGQRLGRGGGYFDRFLSRLDKDIPLIGLAFDFQIVKEVPSLSHDEPVDIVISA